MAPCLSILISRRFSLDSHRPDCCLSPDPHRSDCRLSLDPHRPDYCRRPLPPSTESESGWAGLHYDILDLILKRMKLIEEFVIFGSVCKSWRRIVALEKRNLAPQIPWLMLQENPENKYHWQIYSLSKEDILIKNLYIPELYDKMCIGLNYGWMFAITRLGGEMSLVHPISCSQIELPSRASVEGGYKGKEICPSFHFFKGVSLCGNPSESSNFTVMAVHTSLSYVYYWRPGFKYWVFVMGDEDIQTVTCYQDQFYAVSTDGRFFVLKNDHEGLIVPHLIGKVNSSAFGICDNTPYIVGSTRGLLVVVRERYIEDEGEGFRGVAPQETDWVENVEEVDVLEEVLEEEIEWEDWKYGSVKFRVFELDLINGGYKKIEDLGDRAIFVGHNSSVCFDRASELLGIKSNHIYFTDDYDKMHSFSFKGGGIDMGVYGLEDDQITQFKIDISSHRSRICPPFWFIPSL